MDLITPVKSTDNLYPTIAVQNSIRSTRFESKRMSRMWYVMLVIQLALMISPFRSALYGQSSTCTPGNVDNGPMDLWSEECYLSDMCTLQGNPCTSNDVNLVSVYVADAMGQPLPPCNPGDSQTGYLWGTFSNNIGVSRYAIRTRTEVWINGLYSVELINCSFDSLPSGTSAASLLGTINFQCGDDIQALNTWIAWTTVPFQCSDAMAPKYANECNDYLPSHCYKLLAFSDPLDCALTVTCPPADGGIFQCINQIPPANPALVIVTDSCGPVTKSFAETSIGSGCGLDTFVLTRVYTISDSNATTTCTQIFKASDSMAPVITCPANVSVQCNTSTATTVTGTATAIDNCDATPTITMSEVTVAGSCPQAYTITRTWTAVDDCNNSSTCSQTIQVVDSNTPAITCPPDITIECDESTATTNTGSATASDMCDPDPVIFFIDYLDTPPATSPEMRWLYMPPGTMSGSCVSGTNCTNGTICFSLEYTPGVTGILTSYTTGFFVNCYSGNDPIVSNASCVMVDNSDVLEDCGGSGLILMNSSGNTGTLAVTQNVPVILHMICLQLGAGGSVILDEDEATDLTSSVELPSGELVTETPSYANFTAAYDVFCNQSCIFPNTIFRKFIAVDACGNEGTCTQKITIQDMTPPVITCPPNLTIECNTDSSPAVTGTATATDNCSAPVVIASSDVTIPRGTCPQDILIVRTWTATDECGNTSTCTQTISVEDRTAPQITCPPDLTLQCSADTSPGGANGTATATDNCDLTISIASTDIITPSANCLQNYTISRSWTATDDCGNINTCTQIIVVEDSTSPVITCPSDITIECSANTAPGGTNGTATATDNCDATPTITSTDITVAGPSCPESYIINRIWSATDDCGNFNTCTQIITLTDSTVPLITCPPDVTVECGTSTATASTGNATATDLCDPTPTITFMDFTEGNPPPGQGPSMQWLYFPPGATSGSCTSGTDCASGTICFVLQYTPGNTGILTSYTTGFFLNCYNGNDPVVYNSSCIMTDNSGTESDCGGSGLVLMNSSGNTGVIAVTQDVPIIIHQICLQLGAGGSIVLDEDEATDLTTSVELPNGDLITEAPSFNNFTVNFDTYCGQSCGYPTTISRQFTAEDDCGNSSTCIQLITIQDNTPPVITCPANLTIECNTSTDTTITGVATATDNCSVVTTITSSDVNIPSTACSQEYEIIRTWTATDACGNSSTCAQSISVADNTPPAITCPPDLTLECSANTDPAGSAGMATATDNCDLTVTITSFDIITPSPSCPQEYTINRQWTASDDCGNASTCTQIITIDDSTPPALTCPPDLTLNCNASTAPGGANGMATATDNCNPVPVITNTDVTIGGACPQAYTIMRTWVAADGCGNSSSCSQTLTVIDNSAPSITCPPDVTIECSASTDVASTGDATATDLCDPTPTITHIDLTGNNPPSQTPSMQWLYFPPGATSGNCTSGTDCASGTICFVLQYTPGATGILTSYTTGFFVNCYNGSNPVVSNTSCVMVDNSDIHDDFEG